MLKEEWDEHNIEIKVGYKVKAITDRYLSFVVTGSENWTSAYSEEQYYTIDLDTGKQVSLKDLLGENYKEIADKSIETQVKAREKKEEVDYWMDEWEGVSNKTDFYINQDGKTVIVLQKSRMQLQKRT